MDENTFEIRDGEIDVEKIMEQIRENIRLRKEAGVYPADPPMAQPDPAETHSGVARDVAYLSGNWDIQNTGYFISSHRPLTGKFLVKGREIVHGEVRRYVDPVIWKQAEFNRATGRVLEDMTRRFSGLETLRQQVREDAAGQIRATIGEVRSQLKERLREQDSEVRNGISEVEEKIRTEVTELVTQVQAEVAREVEVEVQKQVRAALLAMDTDIENRAWLAKVLEEKVHRGAAGTVESSDSSSTGTGVNYFVFEERFRGSRQDIKGRQEAFLPYFEGCKNVLDIGCGRGEFLELMRENGIGARGVDIDGTMVEFCRSKDLDVEKVDAISYLETLEDRSLDGIFIDQVVEHLEPAYLVRLLELCCQKLQYGYYLLAETVNPLSFFSLANFYIDMSHVRPVHPETLKFLFGAAGFREIEARFSSPVGEDRRLRKLSPPDGMDGNNVAFIESYNHNIEMLNGILYGAQDYAVIGKK